ncbi:cadherin domain-containing protein, partial [Lentilitoribacter sp. EG35]|uniref:cadherin domain-containing protein n=1 Tax=Lentilitoribacter sp. EG35 TaxID=3234192 RepID=UPI00346067B5
ETFTLAVSDIDEVDVGAITDSNGSANNIDENASAGSVVGITAFATDADASDNISYSLSDDAGGLFTIDANTGVVTTTGPLDAESASSHNITVVATSDDGSTSNETFTIGVNDVNETSITAISDTDGSGNSVAENASTGSVVGVTAFASDADASDHVSYSLSSNPGGFFAIDANTGVVTVASGLDYETDTSHTIEVTATSDDGTISTQSFTIDVSDVNEGPTDMTFGGNAGLDIGVSNTIGAGSVIGGVDSVIDVDSGETFTFALTDDAGGKFEIDTNTGDIKLVAEHDASSVYSDTVDVQVTDSGGNTYTETIGIQLGTDGAETLTGTSNTDIMHGFGGQDTLNGGDGDDVLIAGDADGMATTGSNLITNGGFENTSSGWTLNSGPGFQFYADGQRSVNTTEGNYYLDMDEAPGNIDIEQALSGLSTGTSYQLSFDTAATGGYDASVEVYWNGELIDTITSGTTTMSSNSFTVVGGSGDGSNTIQFVEVGNVDYGGTALDNVQLFEMTPATGDTLNGGDGNDVLVSGSGADTFDGGAGTDTVDYSNATAGVNVAFQDTDGMGSGGEMQNVSAGGHGGEADGDSYTSIESFVGSDHADNVYGGSSDMSFQLGAGNDTFDTSNNTAIVDTVDGGAGNDTIWGGGGNDILTGGTGNDTLYGESGSDMFLFSEGDGADIISGGEGGGWTDTIQLSDTGGDLGEYGTDWTVSLTSGSIDSQDANSLSLSDDADGIITLDDGSTINFLDIERIEF